MQPYRYRRLRKTDRHNFVLDFSSREVNVISVSKDQKPGGVSVCSPAFRRAPRLRATAAH